MPGLMIQKNLISPWLFYVYISFIEWNLSTPPLCLSTDTQKRWYAPMLYMVMPLCHGKSSTKTGKLRFHRMKFIPGWSIAELLEGRKGTGVWPVGGGMEGDINMELLEGKRHERVRQHSILQHLVHEYLCLLWPEFQCVVCLPSLFLFVCFCLTVVANFGCYQTSLQTVVSIWWHDYMCFKISRSSWLSEHDLCQDLIPSVEGPGCLWLLTVYLDIT